MASLGILATELEANPMSLTSLTVALNRASFQHLLMKDFIHYDLKYNNSLFSVIEVLYSFPLYGMDILTVQKRINEYKKKENKI